MLPDGHSLSCSMLLLLYGDFPELHARSLSSILATTPITSELRLGLNEVGHNSLESVADVLEVDDHVVRGVDGRRELGLNGRRVVLYSQGNRNIKKYPMMRLMTQEPRVGSEWLAWFDDDTWAVPDSKWWDTAEILAARPSTVYMGEPWSYPYSDKHRSFIASRPWYHGRPFDTINGKPGVWFCTGGFWVIRSSLFYELGWPDPSIVHNGGDTLLSEAVRQRGLQLTAFPTKQLGLRVNDHPRRGYREAPVGTV